MFRKETTGARGCRAEAICRLLHGFLCQFRVFLSNGAVIMFIIDSPTTHRNTSTKGLMESIHIGERDSLIAFFQVFWSTQSGLMRVTIASE